MTPAAPFPRIIVKGIVVNQNKSSFHAPNILCKTLDHMKNGASSASGGGGKLSITPNNNSENNSENMKRLKMKKAWELALAPAKSIFMTLFMLYMSGNSVQIFSIMITAMTLMNPMKAIFQVNQGR